MKNWNCYKHNWYISWFDIKNVSEDDYLKSCNQIYQENKETYFKKIFNFMYKEHGIHFAHVFDSSHIVWQTPKNIYWCIFRDSERYDRKGKWCFRLNKTTNDNVSCG